MKYFYGCVFLWCFSVSAATVQLVWIGSPAPEVSGYRLYMQTGAVGPFVPNQETPAAQFSTTVNDLSELTQYAFYVTAFNDAFESSPSNIVYWISQSMIGLSRATGLTVLGITGRTYEIQQTTNLLGQWIHLQDVIIGDTGRATIPIDFSQPQMFFRAIENK